MEVEKQENSKENGMQYFSINQIIMDFISHFSPEIVKTSNFNINDRFYLLDRAHPEKTAQEIIAKKKDLEKLVLEKHKRPADFLAKIGHSIVFTMLEYYLEHHDVQQLYISKEEEICSICRCELFEASSDITLKAILENLEKDDENDVVRMDKCEGHYFHVGCLRNYINSQESKDHLKCPNCCIIYGIMMGS